jgi:chain length determinant protein EpsF
MNLQRIMLILRGRWRLALLTAAAVMAFVIGVTVLMPQQYVATASVVADSNKSDPVTQSNVQTDQQAFMATQISIMMSDRVLNEAAGMLNFDKVPELYTRFQASKSKSGFVPWLAKRLRKSVHVGSGAEGNVIEISAVWPDAQQSAAVANAVAQSFINTNLALKTLPAQQYAGLFDQRARALRAELEERQQRLADFEASNGITPTDERIDVESTTLSELSTELIAVQSQRQDSQSRVRQISGSPESSPEVLASPLVAQLKAELANAEARQQNLQTSLGVNHPEYKRNLAEIESLRARIASEGNRIALALGGSTQINLRREFELNAAIEAQKKRLQDLKLGRDQAALLKNDVIQAQHDLDAVTQRLAVSSLESQVQQSNAVLLSAAAVPDEPTSPDWKINAVVGLFFAFVLGIGVALLGELREARVRDTKDIEDVVEDLPFVALIADMRPTPPRPSRPAIAGLLGSGG